MTEIELDTLISEAEKAFLSQHLVFDAEQDVEGADMRYILRFKNQDVANLAELLISQFRSERLAGHQDAPR